MTWRYRTIGDESDPGTATRTCWIAPPGRTERILFALHGAGNDALFGWVGLFKELLLSGTAIFTFDLPGHGRSGQTRFGHESSHHAIRRAFAECVRCAAGMPLHAIGVSLGGSILLAALPALGQGVNSATLVVAPLHINLSARSFLGELHAHNLKLVWREREHYGFTGLIPSFGPFKRDIYPLRLEEIPPPGPFGYVASLNRALDSMGVEKAAQRVEMPVLLAYGQRDRVVPLEQGERIAAALKRSELLRVAKGTHLSTPLEPIVRNRLQSWMREWE